MFLLRDTEETCWSRSNIFQLDDKPTEKTSCLQLNFSSPFSRASLSRLRKKDFLFGILSFFIISKEPAISFV